MDDDIKLAIVAIMSPTLVVAAIAILVFYDSADVTAIIMYSMAGVFAVIGAIMLLGRGSWFVAGYNTMTPEERQRYDPRKVARGGGIIMFGCAILFAVIPHGMTFSLIGLAVLILSMAAGILYMRR